MPSCGWPCERSELRIVADQVGAPTPIAVSHGPTRKGLGYQYAPLASRARPGTGRIGPLERWWRLIAIQTTDNFQAEPVIQAGTIHRHTPNASMGSSPFVGRAFEAENVSPICGGA
jgi:hypothetical protein